MRWHQNSRYEEGFTHGLARAKEDDRVKDKEARAARLRRRYKPHSPRAELAMLIREGRLFEVEQWIAEGKSVSSSVNIKPLTLAADAGFHSMVEVLLRTLPTQPEIDDALISACWKGHLALVRLLIETGAKIEADNFATIWSETPDEVLDYLMERGLVCDPRPLMHELDERDIDVRGLEFFKKYRRTHKEVQLGGDLALLEQVRQDREEQALTLLAAGANPRALLSTLPGYETTSLESAIYGRMRKLVHASKPQKTDDLNGLLETAVTVGSKEICQELVRSGASIDLLFLPEGVIRTKLDSIAYACAIRSEEKKKAELNERIHSLNLAVELGATWFPSSIEEGEKLLTSILKRVNESQARNFHAIFRGHPGAITHAMYARVFEPKSLKRGDKRGRSALPPEGEKRRSPR